MQKQVVIVINPGSTSTKIAIYNRNGEIKSETVYHQQSELDKFHHLTDQLEYRYAMVKEWVSNFLTVNDFEVAGVVGRGGIVKTLKGGTYRVSESFLKDAKDCTYGEHASNFGVLLSDRLKSEFGLKDSFSVDPVSCGNMLPKAEISGVPGIIRDGRAHTLNIKMTARKIARKQNIPFEKSYYVIAHLGGGISVSLVQAGRLVDVNDALLGMGPFAPNRAGSLPLRGVMKLCYNKSEKDVESLFTKNSGLKGYLGTEDVREVVKMVENGNEYATLIYEAFIYQIAKEIGAYFAASKCKAQAIILTGGIAYSEKVSNDLRDYVGTLTEFHIYPGENEMEALAEGIFRVIDGEEKAQEYD
ncbi:MAG: butyrate kinase [Odoribacter sp.]|nr:butyrate kinase [Odoribacter sp.]